MRTSDGSGNPLFRQFYFDSMFPFEETNRLGNFICVALDHLEYCDVNRQTIVTRIPTDVVPYNYPMPSLPPPPRYRKSYHEVVSLPRFNRRKLQIM